VNAIITDLKYEFSLRNAAECDTEKIDRRGGSDYDFENAQDRFERHDDKITAIIHMLRYAFAIDVTYKTNGYGYVIEFTLDGENIHEIINVELQGYIVRWIEAEKQRINEKYFS
jgi:hypothetical protein